MIFRNSSHEYGLFLRLAGVEAIEEGLKNPEPIQIAAYLFGKDSFIDHIHRLKSTDIVSKIFATDVL